MSNDTALTIYEGPNGKSSHTPAGVAGQYIYPEEQFYIGDVDWGPAWLQSAAISSSGQAWINAISTSFGESWPSIVFQSLPTGGARVALPMEADMPSVRLGIVPPTKEVSREALMSPKATEDKFPPKAMHPAIRLLDEWLKDDSGYDEQVWPELRQALDQDRLSGRRLFDD